jgi:hypothetical protein
MHFTIAFAALVLGAAAVPANMIARDAVARSPIQEVANEQKRDGTLSKRSFHVDLFEGVGGGTNSRHQQITVDSMATLSPCVDRTA